MLIHYSESSYGGFVLTPKEYNIQSLEQKFEQVEGNSNNQYVILLRKSTIAHSDYSQLIWSNDLDDCNNQVYKWLNQKIDTQPMMDIHFYANIVDNIANEEIGYGDSWSNGSIGWVTFHTIDK